MSIWKRLRKLFTAKVHSIIDELEDGEQILLQHKRNMRKSLIELTEQHVCMKANIKATIQRISETERRRNQMKPSTIEEATRMVTYDDMLQELNANLASQNTAEKALQQRLDSFNNQYLLIDTKVNIIGERMRTAKALKAAGMALTQLNVGDTLSDISELCRKVQYEGMYTEALIENVQCPISDMDVNARANALFLEYTSAK